MSSMHTGPATHLPPDVIVDIALCRTRASPDLYQDARRLFRIAYPRAIWGGWDTTYEGTMIIPHISHVIRERLGLNKPEDQLWQ